MSKLKIKEIYQQVRLRKNVDRKRLASVMFPNASEISKLMNVGNLLNGNTTRIKGEWVQPLCDELECTPSQLFGMEEQNG